MAPNRKTLIEEFDKAGYELWLAGGLVRDELRKVPLSGDADFTTNAPPDECERIGQKLETTIAKIGQRFGTTGVLLEEGWAEITTFRGDSYIAGSRWPNVTFGSSIEEDLDRRDFTVNAMARNTVTGELRDPFDGQGDIERRLLRAPGDARMRFTEDPLRILRGVRFVSQLGFTIEPETKTGMIASIELLEGLSQERVTAEIERLLEGAHPAAGLEALREIGALPHLLPELATMPGCEQNRFHQFDVWGHTTATVEAIETEEVNLKLRRWAALLHDLGKPPVRHVKKNGEWGFYRHEIVGAEMAQALAERLRLAKHEGALLTLLVRRHMDRPDPDDGRLVRRFMRRLDGHWRDLLALKRADNASHTYDDNDYHDRLEAACERVEVEEAAMLQAESPLDGRELMALIGKEPGPWIARIKDRLSMLVLDGELAPGDKERASLIAQRMGGTTTMPAQNEDAS
ncbi:MAG TPA: RNA nucleotidyltransferase [Dehalococcoidia bacterium]|nr:RNA nucleotidyltransferase [Dehalococcoidia bacterium]|tara:strand:- start:505 stop:1881 length:1377 start_codon:yes stop_codon:yes gene_type:complete